jgi:RimJ/RimL family protein N-acetyltransferase
MADSAPQPSLTTSRLVLRPYTMADAAAVQRMVSNREVASTTLSIPHPYPEDGAVHWLRSIEPKWSDGSGAVFAITLASTGEIVGSIDLRIKPEHQHAEIGYLIAREHWGNGYVTEAAAALLQLGFETLNLRRIFAHHMTHNPASGRVMRKLGMRYEGTMRSHIVKWGEARDIAFYGITREDWERRA